MIYYSFQLTSATKRHIVLLVIPLTNRPQEVDIVPLTYMLTSTCNIGTEHTRDTIPLTSTTSQWLGQITLSTR